jgi:uncharacterized protein (TIGR02246 family)
MDTTSPPSVVDTSVDHTGDIEAITALVKDVERGFNTNDAELIVRPFLQNGSAVDVMGRQLDGLAALHEASSAGLDGPLRDQYASYELTDLTFLRPDVAIGHKRAWATTAEGERLDVGHAMVALYVFVAVDGRWWVAARQNTLVPPPPD